MVAAPLLWDDNLTVFKPVRTNALVQSLVIPLSALAHDQPIPCHTGHGFGHGAGHGGLPLGGDALVSDLRTCRRRRGGDVGGGGVLGKRRVARWRRRRLGVCLLARIFVVSERVDGEFLDVIVFRRRKRPRFGIRSRGPTAGSGCAEHPELAVPPLVWEDCMPATPGCSQVAPTFVTDTSGQNHGMAATSLLRLNGGYRMGVVFERGFEPQEGEYAAVYEADGSPSLAWRVVIPPPPGGIVGCQVARLLLTPSRVWFGGQSVEPPYHSYYVQASYSNISSVSHHINQEQSSQRQAASENALALQPLGAATTLVYDRIDRTTDVLGVANGAELYIPMVYPVNESAIFLQASDLIHWQGWIWNHATHATEALIVPPNGQAVLAFASDGTTLAWVQAPLAPDASTPNPTGDIWTAPFATSRAAVVAHQLRSGSTGAVQGSIAGDGYYIPATFDGMYNVYRLSDGHHWSFTPSPAADGLYYVGDKYLVYSDGGYGIIRQEIAALGPGD